MHCATWEKENSEAIKVRVEMSLFADDATIVGNKKEIEEGVKTTKEVTGKFEERNNDMTKFLTVRLIAGHLPKRKMSLYLYHF